MNPQDAPTPPNPTLVPAPTDPSQPLSIIPPPHKSKMLIIIVIIAALLLGGSVLAFLLMKDDTSAPMKLTTIANDQYEGKAIALALPDPTPAGWKNDISDQDGTFRYTQTSGSCQVTLKHSKGATAAADDGLTAGNSVDTYMGAIESSTADDYKTVTPTKELSLKTNTGETITLETRQATYTGTDAVEYTLQAGVQWLGDTELLAVVACPTSSWEAQQAAVAAFFGEIKVTTY